MTDAIVLNNPFPHTVALDTDPDRADVMFIFYDPNSKTVDSTAGILKRLKFDGPTLPVESASHGFKTYKLPKNKILVSVSWKSLGNFRQVSSTLMAFFEGHRSLIDAANLWVSLQMETGQSLSFEEFHTELLRCFESPVKSRRAQLTIDIPDTQEGRKFLIQKATSVESVQTSTGLVVELDSDAPWLQAILTSKEFYYQKAIDTLADLKKFQGRIALKPKVETAEEVAEDIYVYLKKLWDNRGESNKTEEFLNSLKSLDEEVSQLFLLINKFISYLDEKAWSGDSLNEYKPRRYVARTFVYQHVIIDNVLSLATSRFNLEGSIREGTIFYNLIAYLNDPANHVTVVSEGHRALIAKNILNTTYNPAQFTRQLFDFFGQYRSRVANPQNFSCLITIILYHPANRSQWDVAKKNKSSEPEPVPVFAMQETGDEPEDKKADKIPFHLDNVEDTDHLQREPIAKSLARMINNEIFKKGRKARHSFMIHLQGAWGDGKSTFINLFKKHLPDKDHKWVFVDFNAWQNQHINPPWWLLMDTIYKSIQHSPGHKFGIWWRERWWRLIKLNGMNWISILLLIAIFLVVNVPQDFKWLNLGKLLSNPEDGGDILGVLTSYITILSTAWLLIQTFTKSLLPASSEAARLFQQSVRDPMSELKNHFGKIVSYTDKNIAVFIDDLDRCNSSFAVGLLEGIQTLFKDQPILYVVAGDRKWISTCFENHYKDYSSIAQEPAQKLGYLFLEKAFQLSIRLPRVSSETKEKYWSYILNPTEPQPTLTKQADGDSLKKYFRSMIERFSNKIVSKVDAVEDAIKEGVKDEIKKKLSNRELRDPEKLKQLQHDMGVDAKHVTDAVLEVVDEDMQDVRHLLLNYHHLVDANPRAIKRLANQYTVMRNILIAERKEFEITKLFRWLILQNKYPVFTDWLETNLAQYQKNNFDLPDSLEHLHEDAQWNLLMFDRQNQNGGALVIAEIGLYTGVSVLANTTNKGTNISALAGNVI